MGMTTAQDTKNSKISTITPIFSSSKNLAIPNGIPKTISKAQIKRDRPTVSEKHRLRRLNPNLILFITLIRLKIRAYLGYVNRSAMIIR
jgi:hypothetical protein